MDRQRGRYNQQAAIDELQRRGLWGYVEPILTFGSAVVAEPVSGMMGLAALPWGSDAATRAINRTQEAMTYRPRTEQGQQALQSAGEFLQPVGDAFIGASEYVGDAAYNATGSPAMGALGYSVPTIALEALGLKGASKLSKGRAYEMGDISHYTKGLGGKQRGAVGGITPQDAIKELERRGIDMSKEARLQRARDMGFDTDQVWYHGTGSDFDSFQEGYGGVYFSDSPKYAGRYTDRQGNAAANIIPTHLKLKNTFDTRRPDHRKIYEDKFLMKYGNGTPLREDGLPDWVESHDFQEFFEEEGLPFDSAIVGEPPTILDDGTRVLEKSLLVTKENHIRSVNAAFNPKDAASANILKGIGAAGIGLGYASQKDETN